MQARRLFAELLVRLDLPVAVEAQARLFWFLEEMLRWNRKVNLTAITEPQEAMEKHLLDSLTILPFIHGSERLLDIGSGGGFPGIPLKIVHPPLHLVSVDAAGKKIAFQRHAGRQLQLTGFTPLAMRIEDMPGQGEFRAAFDVIVSRAFASLPAFARHARPLLAEGGFLLAMKGGEGEKELHEARDGLREIGFTRNNLHHLQLPASGARRTLLFLRQG